MTRIGATIVAAALLILLPTNLKGYSKRAKILRENIAGTWIGSTEDELQMIRLTLSPNGEGIIGFSFLEERPCTFRITSWDYNEGAIDIELEESTARCPLDRKFKGVTRGTEIDLTILGKQWKRKALLRNEDQFMRRLKQIEAEMKSAQ